MIVRRIDHHPKAESIEGPYQARIEDIIVQTVKDDCDPVPEDKAAHDGLRSAFEDLVADILGKSCSPPSVSTNPKRIRHLGVST